MARPRDIYRRLPNSIRREIALRRLRRWLRATAYIRWHNEHVGPGQPVVNFFPMRPEPRMQVSWMLRALRFRIGVAPVPGEPTFAWDTGTSLDEGARRSLPQGAINGSCVDVSKSRVDAVWAEVSGYSIQVDPTTNSGRMVVKPEENGAHGGRLVDGPTRRRRGFVYQKFVATRRNGRLLSTRAVIIGPEMPIVLDYWSAESDTFHGPSHCVARAPDEVYSAAEREQTLRFAELMGMDFGELDVIRDEESGLIYVIDANRTSFMPALLSRADLRRSYRQMVPALGRLLEGRAG